jgi:hypothetical protein
MPLVKIETIQDVALLVAALAKAPSTGNLVALPMLLDPPVENDAEFFAMTDQYFGTTTAGGLLSLFTNPYVIKEGRRVGVPIRRFVAVSQGIQLLDAAGAVMNKTWGSTGLPPVPTDVKGFALANVWSKVNESFPRLQSDRATYAFLGGKIYPPSSTLLASKLLFDGTNAAIVTVRAMASWSQFAVSERQAWIDAGGTLDDRFYGMEAELYAQVIYTCWPKPRVAPTA